MSLELVQPIAREPLSEGIYKSLKASILNGTLSPGERIRELELSRWFNTSQGPVREALKLLEQEGLVTREPYKGTFISQITREEVNEVYALRILLESIAVRRFIGRVRKKDIETLRGFIDMMRQAAAEGDVPTLVEHDMMFHQYICETSGSRVLLQIWMIIHGKTRLASAIANRFHIKHLDEIAEMHQPLLDSIAARHSSRALEIINEHIRFIWLQFPEEFWDHLPQEKDGAEMHSTSSDSELVDWNKTDLLSQILHGTLNMKTGRAGKKQGKIKNRY
ncbi:MAG: GntR family transcriptional regulator [Deltaproteobacteria bacterium]|nr:GntR family transcriptional regulator [Deltaproteobacteria bacterium]MBW1961015.1 GntR family transcriptional regulator [Deltaproteobacteria bacterium]MBW2152782.1 GntR family transcriptional regulator [Deltaproteobacteria bacterium]